MIGDVPAWFLRLEGLSAVGAAATLETGHLARFATARSVVKHAGHRRVLAVLRFLRS